VLATPPPDPPQAPPYDGATDGTGTGAATRRQGGRLVLGLVLAWIALDRAAVLTGSKLGSSGLLVGAIGVVATVLVEMLLFGPPLSFRRALRRVGLGRPAASGVAAALATAVLMLTFFPAFSFATGAPLALREGWPLLAAGLLAQGGIAEECLFRGYLFGHLRRTRSFWRAAALSLPPFVAVHLLLFTYLAPLVAGVALALSLLMSFPLARLYDLGGRTIWAPALLHGVAQGAVKLVVVPETHQLAMGIAWMGMCMVVPWIVFALRSAERR
jgi:membrane protease YdiL (CAAX protease family)